MRGKKEIDNGKGIGQRLLLNDKAADSVGSSHTSNYPTIYEWLVLIKSCSLGLLLLNDSWAF